MLQSFLDSKPELAERLVIRSAYHLSDHDGGKGGKPDKVTSNAKSLQVSK